MSHNVLYMRGQVAELRGNVDEAQRWYEEALSISPTHVKSMQRLVSESAGPARPGALRSRGRLTSTVLQRSNSVGLSDCPIALSPGHSWVVHVGGTWELTVPNCSYPTRILCRCHGTVWVTGLLVSSPSHPVALGLIKIFLGPGH